MRTYFPRKLVGPLALLITVCGVLAAPTPSVKAEGLPKFTGYTTPGSVGEPMRPAEGKPIVREEKNGLGVTVLYSVYDRADGRPGDIWNTGIKGLDESFTAGKDPTGQTGARKLPISTEHPAAKDRKYANPSPYYLAPKPYRTAHIAVDNKIAAVADDPTGAKENIGRVPEEVMLLSSAVFEGPPKMHLEMAPAALMGPRTDVFAPPTTTGFFNPYFGPAPFWGGPMMGPYVSPVTTVGYASSATSVGGPFRGVGSADDRNHSPAFRAYWLDKPLQPGERSTLFGFTSDFPPVYEDTRVRGNSKLAIGLGIGFGDPDLRTAALNADGEVPTPIAFEAPSAAPSVGIGGFGGGFSTLGGTTGGGGGSFGGGGSLPGFGGSLGSTGGGSGGGSPSGGGGNGSGNTTTQPQQQQQQQGQQQQQQPVQQTTVTTGGSLATQQQSNNGTPSQQSGRGRLLGTLLSLLTSGFATPSQFSSPTPSLFSAGGASDRQAVIVNTPVNVTNVNTNEQQQQQKQQQQQQQKQKQSQSTNQMSCPPSTVVPEPAAVFAGLLGLPVFLLFARRKKTPPVENETPQV